MNLNKSIGEIIFQFFFKCEKISFMNLTSVDRSIDETEYSINDISEH